jgi:hypothetical protein
MTTIFYLKVEISTSIVYPESFQEPYALTANSYTEKHSNHLLHLCFDTLHKAYGLMPAIVLFYSVLLYQVPNQSHMHSKHEIDVYVDDTRNWLKLTRSSFWKLKEPKRLEY